MPNRLIRETSPYLVQHADNPVDWWPWCKEALALARESNLPVLLSIGYSACHWCHAMAHECFEDEAVAGLMNTRFVNVKVDREERPDLDQIYQTAHQLLTGRSGGWPLTMFLTPDGAPFYGGTYFPRVPRFGLPGFPDLLERIARAFRERRAEIEDQNAGLRAALAQDRASGVAEREPLDDGPVAELVDQLHLAFDDAHGGFGDAPKFPNPADLAFLLRRYLIDADGRALTMVLKTLDGMAAGGIYDHLGGGFCRYSVDAQWEIPHFEKMLYDNGPLLRLFAEAHVLTGRSRYREVAEETADWVMREMESPDGGYFSSLDADSEGEEGRFYVWSPDEVREVLDAADHDLVARCYGLDGPPNFERRHWHLHLAHDAEDIARAFDMEVGACEAALARGRKMLFEARGRRVRPRRDDKLLTGWNALMIEGMTRAGVLLGRPNWIDSAQRALDNIRTTLWREGRLLASGKDGRAHLNAYLDDHANLLTALLEMLQADFQPAHLAWAREIADRIVEQYEDRETGGFFFTSHDHEALIARPKPIHDAATPSGNAVAAHALQRLGHLVGEVRFVEAARRCVQWAFPIARKAPGGLASYMAALEEVLAPPTVVILRGPAEQVEIWRARMAAWLRPHLLIVPLAENRADDLPATLARPLGSAVNAWVCTGVTCLPPISDWAELERICKPRHIG